MPPRSNTRNVNRGPVYLYYKLWDDDRHQLVASKRAVPGGDPYIGRVDAWQITAPFTGWALVERICAQEERTIGIDWDHDDAQAYGSMLLKTVRSTTAYNLDDSMDVMGPARPGATVQEPMFLKLWYEELQAIFPSVWRDLPDPAEERKVDSHLAYLDAQGTPS
ncbi:hypothetical protein HMN09_00851500 [Mycena chlorophos]|uniref:Uncharacterized protein n=1 Tax=Mycena chlorophos TaxID=658473 RepID=A0A8H6STA2_MYCCL|nr:hypothetical protein HMN09_00851500 [Mycena chlorophos]